MASKLLKRTVLAGLAAALAVLPVASAHAATFVSDLVYRDGKTGVQPSFGKVTLTEAGEGHTVFVSVTLAAGLSIFINTGGPHNPFVFSTVNSDQVTILNPVDTFLNGGRGAFDSTPFGTFTNDIACCNNGNGQSHGETPPLNFKVYDVGGLTVAGIGYTVDSLGKVTSMGTGDRFIASLADNKGPGGFLFSADIYDGGTGKTYNVASKYFTRISTSVPEPASWALMIVGFGATGAMLRRRQRRPLAA